MTSGRACCHYRELAPAPGAVRFPCPMTAPALASGACLRRFSHGHDASPSPQEWPWRSAASMGWTHSVGGRRGRRGRRGGTDGLCRGVRRHVPSQSLKPQARNAPTIRTLACRGSRFRTGRLAPALSEDSPWCGLGTAESRAAPRHHVGATPTVTVQCSDPHRMPLNLPCHAAPLTRLTALCKTHRRATSPGGPLRVEPEPGHGFRPPAPRCPSPAAVPRSCQVGVHRDSPLIWDFLSLGSAVHSSLSGTNP